MKKTAIIVDSMGRVLVGKGPDSGVLIWSDPPRKPGEPIPQCAFYVQGRVFSSVQDAESFRRRNNLGPCTAVVS